MKLTKEEMKENINITAGRVVGRARVLNDKRLLLLALKLENDLKRLKVFDLERT
jgi:hypothetical protein